MITIGRVIVALLQQACEAVANGALGSAGEQYSLAITMTGRLFGGADGSAKNSV